MYFIAQGSGVDRAIVLNSNNHVICLPGCKIVRIAHNGNVFDSDNLGVLSGGSKDGKIFNARWIGGEFISEQNAAGEYAPGHVVRIIGDDILLQDMIINGFGAADTATEQRGAVAMALLGNRIRVVNPRVIHPFPANGAGIRVYGGTGFRCVGGAVASGGDAALQFSAGRLDGFQEPEGITDGAYLGTRCTSVDGRLLLVGTGEERIDGRVTEGGDGECLRIQNNVGNGPNPRPGGSIRDVDVVDVRLAHAGTAARAVVIQNEFDQPGKRIAGVRFRNLWIDTPTDVAFSCSCPLAVTPGEDGPIQDVSWITGGVRDPTTTNTPALSLERLTGGVFAGLLLVGGTNRPTVLLGGTGNPIGVPSCRRIAFEDVAIAGLAAGEVGLTADIATDIVWSRGSVAGAAATTPAAAAFRLLAGARRVTVAGAVTENVATAVLLDPAATASVRDGFGDRRRSAVELGAA